MFILLCRSLYIITLQAVLAARDFAQLCDVYECKDMYTLTMMSRAQNAHKLG